MKKIFLFLLLNGILVSSPAIAGNISFAYACKPFAGPYAGVNLGYRNFVTDDNNDTSIFIPGVFDININSSPKTYGSSAIGGIALGEGSVVNDRLFLGIEGRANFANTKVTSASTLTEVNSTLIAPTDLTVTLRNEYSLLLKIGYISNQDTLFYGLIGPQWGDFKITTNDSFIQDVGASITASTYLTKSQYNTGFLLGAGIEHKLNNCFSAGLEFTHVNYNRLNYPTTTTAPIFVDGIFFPGSAFTINHTIDAQTNTIFAKFNYYFT